MNEFHHDVFGEMVIPDVPGTFCIAYTPNIVNKAVVNRIKAMVDGRSQDVTYTSGFLTEWMDYNRLAEVVIDYGYGISRPFDGYKRDETISMISYVGLDFDEVPEDKFEEIKKHPFVQGRGFFHYSASHGKKPGVCGHWICPLEYGAKISTKEHREAWGVVLQEMVDQIELGDKKVKDLQRLFYGAKGQGYEVWGDGRISIAELERIYQVGAAKAEEQAARRAVADQNSKKRRRRTGATKYTLADAMTLTEEYVVPNLVNGKFPDIDDMDSYYAWLGYFLGWAEEIGIENSIKLMERYAPDRSMGSASKLRSFHKQQAEGIRRYTFGTTMRLLMYWGYDPAGEVFGQIKIHADRTVDHRYLTIEDITVDQKCVIVKSPKGTGKTELIAHLASLGLRVLIVGHRRALLRNTTGRTGIPNYQDMNPSDAESLCITVDSLHKLDLKKQRFDIVIIDEVEQVLQHCTGETLKENRPTELSIFRWVLKQADKVYCFDADMGYVTVNFMSKHLGKKNVFVVENVHKLGGKVVEMYSSKYEIVQKTHDAVRAGEKVALATNSRSDAKTVYESLIKEFPDLRVMTITQDNSDDKEVQAFIQDINNRIMELDVLIYSPSLGTGVSIDPIEPYFDVVHLIGVKDVTTHYDLDQQVCRVRQIKQGKVRAYVGFMYENEERRTTDIQQLKRQCVDNSHETGIRIEIKEDGSIEADTSDGWYVELWADITSLRNKSMNNLNRCFVRLMQEQGHTVVLMKSDPRLKEAGKVKTKEARQTVDKKRVDGIVAAPLLDDIAYQEVTSKESNRPEEKAAIEKYELHQFYQQDVTEELIEMDAEGKLQEKIILLEMVLGNQDASHFDTREASIRTGILETESRVMIPHRRFYGQKKTLINEALKRAGLGQLEGAELKNFGQGRTYSTKSLKDNGFVEWLNQEETQDRLQRHLDITVRTNVEEQAALVVGQILRRIGLDVKEKRVRAKRDPNKKDSIVREYAVSDTTAEKMATILKVRADKYHEFVGNVTMANSIRIAYEEKGEQKEVYVRPEDVFDLKQPKLAS